MAFRSGQPTSETNRLPIAGRSVSVSDEFARPANTTAYAASDRVSATTNDSATTALRALDGIGGSAGGAGTLTKIVLETDKAASMTPQFRIWFYSVAQPTTAVAGDNAAYPIKWANRAQRLGYVDLPAFFAPSGTGTDVSIAEDLFTRMPFQCAAADDAIYYAIETLSAFTPTSGQSFRLTVQATLD